MKTRYILTLVVALALSFTACKDDAKKAETKEVSKEAPIAKLETVSLNISGMTCEIGCAKTIQSKLSKKDGVASAKVVFKDSVATVEFDANQTSSDELITFINGIAGGDLYSATEVEEVASEK